MKKIKIHIDDSNIDVISIFVTFIIVISLFFFVSAHGLKI